MSKTSNRTNARSQTQKKLDEYNELYSWSYNDMCDFIESYRRKSVCRTIMTHITDLCDDYSMRVSR